MLAFKILNFGQQTLTLHIEVVLFAPTLPFLPLSIICQFILMLLPHISHLISCGVFSANWPHFYGTQTISCRTGHHSIRVDFFRVKFLGLLSCWQIDKKVLNHMDLFQIFKDWDPPIFFLKIGILKFVKFIIEVIPDLRDIVLFEVGLGNNPPSLNDFI